MTDADAGADVTKADDESYDCSFESFSPIGSQSFTDNSGSKREEEEQQQVAGIDLETFMGNYEIDIGMDNKNCDDPSMRPLEGVSPTKVDRDQELQARFGTVDKKMLASPPPPVRVTSSGSGLSPSKKQARPISPVVSSRGDKIARYVEKGYQEETESLLARIHGSSHINDGDDDDGDHASKDNIFNMNDNSSRLNNSNDDSDDDKYETGRVHGADRGKVTDQDISYYKSLVAGSDVKTTTSNNDNKKSKNKSRNIHGNRKSIVVENAERVDALLMKKFQPDDTDCGKPYGTKESTNKKTNLLSTRETLKKLKEKHEQMESAMERGKISGNHDDSGSIQSIQNGRIYGLNAPGYFGNSSAIKAKSNKLGSHSSSSSIHHISPPRAKRVMKTSNLDDQQSTSSSQVAQLKKELKHRDERLQRLTEHSLTLGQTSDQQKAEIASLQEQLNRVNMDLDAKEQRAQDAMRLRKKAQKKAKNLENLSKGIEELEADNARLRDREAALIEAVEALSSQNEDLIKKLKTSLARELELSQLSEQNGQYSPRSQPRAQSDTRLQRKVVHGSTSTKTRNSRQSRNVREDQLPRL